MIIWLTGKMLSLCPTLCFQAVRQSTSSWMIRTTSLGPQKSPYLAREPRWGSIRRGGNLEVDGSPGKHTINWIPPLCCSVASIVELVASFLGDPETNATNYCHNKQGIPGGLLFSFR